MIRPLVLLLVAVIGFLLVVACEKESKLPTQETETAPATASPEPAPVPTTPLVFPGCRLKAELCRSIAKIDAIVGSGRFPDLVGMSVPQQIVCGQDETSATMASLCSGRPPGVTVAAYEITSFGHGALWDGGGYQAELKRTFARALPAERDQYGPGHPRAFTAGCFADVARRCIDDSLIVVFSFLATGVFGEPEPQRVLVAFIGSLDGATATIAIERVAVGGGRRLRNLDLLLKGGVVPSAHLLGVRGAFLCRIDTGC